MIHGGNVWEGDPKSWLDFSANLRPEGPPEWVRDVLVRSLDHVRYYPDRSMRSARAGLARSLGLPEEQVLPTAGGAAAIDLILSAGKGRVLIPQPTFGEYAARAAVHGRETVLLGNTTGKGVGLPHSGSLSSVSTEKAAVPKDPVTPRKGDTLVLCNPNNPDGRLLSAGQIMAEYDKVHAASAELLVDEAFIGFAPEESVRHMVRPGLLVAGSMTKVLCIPGIRLGYIAGDAAAVATLAERMLPWSISTQAAEIAAALPDHLEELQEDCRLNARRRAIFARQLAALGADVSPSAANFLLVRFPREMQDTVRALKQRGILVRTCESFGLSAHYLRLAVRLEEENERLISELKNALQS